jgi:SHS2 domain-containing protein
MILNNKNKEQQKRHCAEGCKCGKHRNKPQRFDDGAETPRATTLEEHFENFADGVAEVTENFLGLGKKAKVKREARKERKVERQEARQEKRISRIKTRQNIRETKANALGQKLSLANEGLNIKNQLLQAQTQADTTNQLAQAVQPNATPVSASETPTGNDILQQARTQYAQAQEQAPEQAQEQATEETGKGIEAPTTEAPKKSNTMIYIIIAVAVIGAYFLMKKK